MSLKSLALAGSFAALASTTALSQAKPDFEYNGYMRSGVGFSRGGTQQDCFKAVGSETGKYRLGNECETYIEAAFTKRGTAKGATFGTHFRLAAVSGQERDWEPTSTDVTGTAADGTPELGSEFTLALREAYVTADGVLGKATPWIGKRFYRRHDIHILDFYTLDNSGPGFGVENIGLGSLALHTAVVRNVPTSADGPAQSNIDLRLSGLDFGSAGNLEVALIYGTAGKRGHATGTEGFEPLNGTNVSLFHNLKFGDANNKVTVQYGQGLFGARADTRTSTLTAFGGGGDQEIAKGKDKEKEARKKSSTLRIVEEVTGSLSKSLSLGFVALHQKTDVGGLKDATGKEIEGKAETSVGARPVLHFDEHTALALEVGNTTVGKAIDLGGGKYEDASLLKVTLAPQITAGDGFWARPTLRLFGTYAKWNKEAKGLGDQGGVYAKDENGFSTGAQLEAWW